MAALKFNPKFLLTTTNLVLSAAVLVAIFFGLASVFLAGAAGDHYGLILALPGVLILGGLFLFNRNLLFYLIILSRSAMDPIFDTTKFSGVGLGGALNLLVLLLAVITIYQNPKPVSNMIKNTWFVFLFIYGASLTIAPDFLTGLKLYIGLLSYAAVFAMSIVLVKSEEDYGKWIRAVLMSSIIPVIYAFYELGTGGGHTEDGLRIKSTFSHPNIFAFYLVLMISLSFYLIKSKINYIAPKLRFYILIYICVMIGLLLLTKTRSAWMACFAFFTLYGIFYERKYLVVVITLPFIALLIPDIRDRLSDLTSGNEVVTWGKLNSYAWRKYIWESGLGWMQPSHYLLGYGAEAFFIKAADFFPLSGGRPTGAHSVYVQLFFDIGAIGLASFAWIYVRMGIYLAAFYQANKLMISMSILFLIEYGLFAYSDNMLAYLNFNWYFWFVIGAAFSLSYHNQNAKLKI